MKFIHFEHLQMTQVIQQNALIQGTTSKSRSTNQEQHQEQF